jgi:hypothetical protein
MSTDKNQNNKSFQVSEQSSQHFGMIARIIFIQLFIWYWKHPFFNWFKMMQDKKYQIYVLKCTNA